MNDLLFLLADKNMAEAVAGLLERDQALLGSASQVK